MTSVEDLKKKQSSNQSRQPSLKRSHVCQEEKIRTHEMKPKPSSLRDLEEHKAERPQDARGCTL